MAPKTADNLLSSFTGHFNKLNDIQSKINIMLQSRILLIDSRFLHDLTPNLNSQSYTKLTDQIINLKSPMNRFLNDHS